MVWKSTDLLVAAVFEMQIWETSELATTGIYLSVLILWGQIRLGALDASQLGTMLQGDDLPQQFVANHHCWKQPYGSQLPNLLGGLGHIFPLPSHRLLQSTCLLILPSLRIGHRWPEQSCISSELMHLYHLSGRYNMPDGTWQHTRGIWYFLFICCICKTRQDWDISIDIIR